jgi:hypothetical protein
MDHSLHRTEDIDQSYPIAWATRAESHQNQNIETSRADLNPNNVPQLASWLQNSI